MPVVAFVRRLTMVIFQCDLTRTLKVCAFSGGRSWEAVSGTGWAGRSSSHTLPPAANAQVKKLLAGLRACEERYDIADVGSPSHVKNTVAAMTRTFAYRCGGSDGITSKQLLWWCTVFPFNPLTEQSEGHLQTHGGG